MLLCSPAAKVESDPILEANLWMEMQSMNDKTLPVCIDRDNIGTHTSWTQLVQEEEEVEQEEDKWEDDEMDSDPAPQSFKESLLALEMFNSPLKAKAGYWFEY